MKIPNRWLLAAVALTAPSVAFSQTAAQAAAEAANQQRTQAQVQRQLQQFQLQTQQVVSEMPTRERTFFDYGAYVTPSYLSFDDPNGDNHVLREYDFVPWAHVNLDNVHDFYARGRVFYQDWNQGDSFDNQPDGMQGRLEEGYYRFNLQRYLSAYKGIDEPNGATFTIGRQYTQWANGLVLAQYLDGGRADFTFDKVDLTLLAGVTAGFTVDFSADRPNFDNDTRRGFYGAMLGEQIGKHHPYVYALFQQDYNSDDPLTIGMIRTEFSYNSYYLGGGMNGSLSDNLLYKSEITFEGGTSLSNSFDQATFEPVAQTNDTIMAGAADFQLDYLLQDSHKTHLFGETILATGDPDRLNTSNTFGGNRPNTFDQAFNAWGYVNTGLAFAPQASNLMSFRFGLSTYPLPDSGWFSKLQVVPSVIISGKMRANGGFNEVTNNDRYLGWEPDLAVNWQITEDVFVTGRYGIFFPGDAIPNNDTRQFIYLAVTYAF